MAGLTPPRPLREDDDRSGFDCGRASLNTWFHRHAWRNQDANVSRTSVVSDPADGHVIGYVSLSAAQIERAWLTKAAQRNRPDPIPMLLLGQLAIDLRDQGRGYSTSLMFYALTTAVRFSRDIGCFGVMTHPLDDGVRAFYERFGFEELPGDPLRSMAVRVVDLERAGIGVG
ncbi:MAG: N-acetyltransferase [Caulobacter sp.]|nr:N-acetyltransferase [Caulobacter sp.]